MEIVAIIEWTANCNVLKIDIAAFFRDEFTHLKKVMIKNQLNKNVVNCRLFMGYLKISCHIIIILYYKQMHRNPNPKNNNNTLSLNEFCLYFGNFLQSNNTLPKTHLESCIKICV